MTFLNTPQPTDWVDTHPGWVTLIGAFVTALITLAYVILTWKLVAAGRKATKAADEANTVAKDANAVAQLALDADRRQYLLALRNRQDAAMPAVAVRFEWTALHRPGARPEETYNVGTVTRQEFNTSAIVIRSTFSLTNYGPGPALFSMEATSNYSVRQLKGGNVPITSQPDVIAPGDTRHQFIVDIVTDGSTIFQDVMGKPYAEVRFRWSSMAEPNTYDEAALTLTSAPENLVSGNVDNAFLARAFPQAATLLLGTRTYASEPSLWGQAGPSALLSS
jgi:hypothetical protein